MNKKEIMRLIKELCFTQDYEILNGTHEYPKHIRLNGIGDVWPTTGTLKLNGDKVFYKKMAGLNKLASVLDKKINPDEVKKKMIDRISELENLLEAALNQITELTEYAESMDERLSLLELKV